MKITIRNPETFGTFSFPCGDDALENLMKQFYPHATVMDEDLRQMMWNLIDRETVSPLYTRNESDEPEMTM